MYELTFNGRAIGEVTTHFCRAQRAATSAAEAVMLLSNEFEAISKVSVKRVS